MPDDLLSKEHKNEKESKKEDENFFSKVASIFKND